MNSIIRTVRQHIMAVSNRFFLNHAITIPTIRAAYPATGFFVASVMAGKVMTDRVA